MTIIHATPGTSTATAWFNQRKLVRTAAGRLWTVIANATDDRFEFRFSDDHGATWSEDASMRIGVVGDPREAALYIDADDHAHVAYVPDGSTNSIVYRRKTNVDSVGGWNANIALPIPSDRVYWYPDVVAHREGTGWVAHVVFHRAHVTDGAILHHRLTTDSGGSTTWTGASEVFSAPSGGIAVRPSVDFQHTGDGKTISGGAPHLFVAASTLNMAKATYAAGAWTWGPTRAIDTTRRWLGAEHWLTSFFDGTRFVMTGQLDVLSSGAEDIVLYERNAADTTTTTRVLAAGVTAGSFIRSGSAAYDANGNVYLVGADGTSGVDDADNLVIRKWDRASNTFEPEISIDSTSRPFPHASCLRLAAPPAVAFVVTGGTGAVPTVEFKSLALNVAPNAPTGLTPTGGATIDKDVTQRFAWTFSDPDPGDSQSMYDLRYRVVGAGTWTVVSGTTTNPFRDFVGGTFAAGDYEWQVRTYDAAGVVGPYSSSAFFTAAVSPSGHAITDPINGGTISTEDHTVTWSAPQQDAYQLRVVGDLAGVPDEATIHTDTGTVVSTVARSKTITFATNGITVHVQLRIQVAGLWSAWASNSVTVSYTVPAVPTLAVAQSQPSGAITLQATHPAPVGAEPAVTSTDFYVRVADLSPGTRADGERLVGGDGVRIARDRSPSLPWVDWAVASGVEYEYRARARGDNGTSSYSEWTSAGDGVVDGEILDGGTF